MFAHLHSAKPCADYHVVLSSVVLNKVSRLGFQL